jgi:hypothetical protein
MKISGVAANGMIAAEMLNQYERVEHQRHMRTETYRNYIQTTESHPQRMMTVSDDKGNYIDVLA